jgi:hypothetical protein
LKPERLLLVILLEAGSLASSLHFNPIQKPRQRLSHVSF